MAGSTWQTKTVHLVVVEYQKGREGQSPSILCRAHCQSLKSTSAPSLESYHLPVTPWPEDKVFIRWPFGVITNPNHSIVQFAVSFHAYVHELFIYLFLKMAFVRSNQYIYSLVEITHMEISFSAEIINSSLGQGQWERMPISQVSE